jgi:rhamnose transport system ATP-binding protein
MIVKLYDVRPPTPDLPASKLSGGNQQKVVLGKWLHRPLRVLILDEPTRGVDVAAKAQVHGLLKDAADQGTGVIVVSSDLPELISVSDRVLVMCDGRVTAELTGSQITEETVMRNATP